MDIGDRIKERRILLNMTMQELGDKVGVQNSAVNKWEKGLVTNIKRSTVKKLADALECSPTWLMWGDEGKTEKEKILNDTAYTKDNARLLASAIKDPDAMGILSKFFSLSAAGRKSVIEYVDFLTSKND